MQNVSNLSILTMLIMYMLSALFGYLTFYGKSGVALKRRWPRLIVDLKQPRILASAPYLDCFDNFSCEGTVAGL